MRVMEVMAVFLWKDVSELFTVRVMNDDSSVGQDTKLCDTGLVAVSNDALPVLCLCYLFISFQAQWEENQCFYLLLFFID